MVEGGIYRSLAVLRHESLREAVVVELFDVCGNERIGHLSLVVTDYITDIYEVVVLEPSLTGAVKKNIPVAIVHFSESVIIGIHHIE